MTVGPMFSERVSQLMRPSSSAMDSTVKPWGHHKGCREGDALDLDLRLSICGGELGNLRFQQRFERDFYPDHPWLQNQFGANATRPQKL